MINRRNFLRIGVFFTSAFGGYGVLRWHQRQSEVEALKLAFGERIIDDPAVVEFLADFRKMADEKSYRGVSVNTVAFGKALPTNELPSRRGVQAIWMISTSTNILQALTDGREIVYTGLFDPYKTPCQNTLSAHAEDL